MKFKWFYEDPVRRLTTHSTTTLSVAVHWDLAEVHIDVLQPYNVSGYTTYVDKVVNIASVVLIRTLI